MDLYHGKSVYSRLVKMIAWLFICNSTFQTFSLHMPGMKGESGLGEKIEGVVKHECSVSSTSKAQ